MPQKKLARKDTKPDLEKLRAGSLYLATPGMAHKEDVLSEALITLERLPASAQVLKAVVESGSQALVDKTDHLFGDDVWKKFNTYTETFFEALDASRLEEPQRRRIFKAAAIEHANPHATLRALGKAATSNTPLMDIVLDVMAQDTEILLDGILNSDLIYHARMRACAPQISRHLTSLSADSIDTSDYRSFRTTDRGRLILLKMGWCDLPYVFKFNKRQVLNLSSAHEMLAFCANLPDLDVLLSQTQDQETQLLNTLFKSQETLRKN